MGDSLLESLRAEGLHLHDPARFRYLEVLARRLPLQPSPVQQLLQQRWHTAVADYAQRARSAPGLPASAAAITTDAPLSQLNRYLQARTEGDMPPGLAGGGARMPDMKSVRRFSEVWSKISAEQQVAQALVGGPENAGPLNSHRLMLRALRLMRGLSPDYTQRFMAQMDALLWLEQVHAKATPTAARPVRKSRRKSLFKVIS